VSSYSRLYAHIVFSTRDRAPMIVDAWRDDLHRYLGGTISGLGAVPIVIGGVADHIHILLSFRPQQDVSSLVREIKKASAVWAKERYERFGWQEGYSAFTVGHREVPTITAYIEGQEEHHRTVTWQQEFRELLAEAGLDPDQAN